MLRLCARNCFGCRRDGMY